MRRTILTSPPVCPAISHVILYVRDIERVATFYESLFGMRRIPSNETGWLELESPSGGCSIALHIRTSVAPRVSTVKLVFGVADVSAFKAAAGLRGLRFGKMYRVAATGHQFANMRDPAGNLVSISSRRMKK